MSYEALVSLSEVMVAFYTWMPLVIGVYALGHYIVCRLSRPRRMYWPGPVEDYVRIALTFLAVASIVLALVVASPRWVQQASGTAEAMSIKEIIARQRAEDLAVARAIRQQAAIDERNLPPDSIRAILDRHQAENERSAAFRWEQRRLRREELHWYWGGVVAQDGFYWGMLGFVWVWIGGASLARHIRRYKAMQRASRWEQPADAQQDDDIPILR